MGRFRIVVSLSILTISLILFIISLTGDSNSEAIRAGALIIFAMGFWATGALPEYLTALIFLLMAVISRVAPAPVVFSGFSSGALWLVFGGLIIAAAVKSTGFGKRLSHRMLAPAIASYAGVISSIVFLTILLSFFYPRQHGTRHTAGSFGCGTVRTFGLSGPHSPAKYHTETAGRAVEFL